MNVIHNHKTTYITSYHVWRVFTACGSCGLLQLLCIIRPERRRNRKHTQTFCSRVKCTIEQRFSSSQLIIKMYRLMFFLLRRRNRPDRALRTTEAAHHSPLHRLCRRRHLGADKAKKQQASTSGTVIAIITTIVIVQ